MHVGMRTGQLSEFPVHKDAAKDAMFACQDQCPVSRKALREPPFCVKLWCVCVCVYYATVS